MASPVGFEMQFPSIYKPLQKSAPQKRPLKNIRPGAYFWNYTVYFCRLKTIKGTATDNLLLLKKRSAI